MSKAVDIFSGILFVRTRHYDDVKKVVVLQGNKPERRFFEERPQGEWIIIDDTEQFIAKCSICGRIEDSRMIKDYPFCHCGADMRGEENGNQN